MRHGVLVLCLYVSEILLLCPFYTSFIHIRASYNWSQYYDMQWNSILTNTNGYNKLIFFGQNWSIYKLVRYALSRDVRYCMKINACSAEFCSDMIWNNGQRGATFWNYKVMMNCPVVHLPSFAQKHHHTIRSYTHTLSLSISRHTHTHTHTHTHKPTTTCAACMLQIRFATPVQKDKH